MKVIKGFFRNKGGTGVDKHSHAVVQSMILFDTFCMYIQFQFNWTNQNGQNIFF